MCIRDRTGIIYEPWHYRYVGEEDAKKIMESGMTLEEYLDCLLYTSKDNFMFGAVMMDEGNCKGLLERVLPVSYTHLDVYKRQVKEKRQQLYEMFEKKNCWKKIRAYLQYRKFCNLFGSLSTWRGRFTVRRSCGAKPSRPFTRAPTSGRLSGCCSSRIPCTIISTRS